ncbi:MAG: aminomethyl-transferring glycine dehydrogenase [Actinomycetia bacterium]|nr:aminomethyl-transferring glycine dehydrogenase [Actinomycetes bacterium]
MNDSADNAFAQRHIGPDQAEVATMLEAVGHSSMGSLLDALVPDSIRTSDPLRIDEVVKGAGSGSEAAVLARLEELAAANTVATSLIGCGWNDTVTPPVILRNMIENPGWYTAYTPYQPEISQGRLEMLLNFQTLVADLCGMDIANSSMLDEATAAAEAMTLARRQSKVDGNVFWVDSDCHPQVLDVVVGRAAPLGIDIRTFDPRGDDPFPPDAFGVLLAHPGSSGAVRDHRPRAAAASDSGAVVCVTTDLLALTVLEPPGSWGADVVVGSAQRFGVPLGYGGPHAGFMAVSDRARRALPGRLVGVSVDSSGSPAFRLALQTREQHIRREKATSNICTAQVLLANVAAAYAVYHGPEGLTAIAQRVNGHASELAASLAGAGHEVLNDTFFDTLAVSVPGHGSEVVAAAQAAGLLLRLVDHDTVGVSLDETSSTATVEAVLKAFSGVPSGEPRRAPSGLPKDQERVSTFCEHPTFHAHRSETEMMRYLRKLADADLALDRTMIPLGSCTMKLNAAVEMMPVTWPEYSGIHPFAPPAHAAGYLEMISELEAALCAMTGYDAVSLQPNAGSQGELAGLLAISAYHASRGEPDRDVCLIPSSAHGTNAASAVMAGMRVVVVDTDESGNVDMADLRARAEEHGDRLAAAMVTYPSTHGVFEEGITELCRIIHENGGQVYVDGANLNALVGVAKPGWFGADVSHLNLHKTFCIPHGGGGPGVGPVAAMAHLAPFLPGHRFSPREQERDVSTVDGPGNRPTISAAPFGSAGILPISWAYIALMGDALTEATAVAILSANYIAARLGSHYPVLYSGSHGLVAHECILDLREIASSTGVSAEDVAKRLIDYGFHAPTLSFPVAGTLMVEPTESESLGEIDRFCDAMIAIRAEIDRVGNGTWPTDDNPLANAPHTAEVVGADSWEHTYERSTAAWPVAATATGPAKYWPPVSRIDGGYGDRNLVCSCPPPEDFAS